MLLLLPTSAIGQIADPISNKIYTEQNIRAAMIDTDRGANLMSNGAPNDRATAGFSQSNIQFSSENEEKRLSLAFSFDLESYAPKVGMNGFYHISRTKLSVVASAPIDENKAVARLLSGDSLVDGTKVKLSLVRFSNVLGNGAGAVPMVREAYKNCLENAIKTWNAQIPTEQADVNEIVINQYEDKLASRMAISPDKSYHIEISGLAAGTVAGSLPAYIENYCVPDVSGRKFQNQGQLVEAFGDKSDEFLEKFFNKKSRVSFIGIDASVGRDKYGYLDRAMFQLAEVSKTSWEVGAFAGLLNNDLTFSLRGRVVYGSNLKLPDEIEVCHVVAGQSDPHCLTGADGLPVRKDTALVSLETRHVIALNKATKIAVAPQLVYRSEDEEFGAEVPIYLAPDKDGRLNGGIKLAYTTKGDEFGVGVFIGVPFSMFFQ